MMLSSQVDIGPSECKPNYEKRAAQVKKDIEASKNLLSAMEAFSKSQIFSRFHNKHTDMFVMIYGAVRLILLQQEDEYQRLLDLIEAK